MASPPYFSAASPPAYASTSKKRTLSNTSGDHPSTPATGTAVNPPHLKRRKPSMLSTVSASSASHPLRQASFPPLDDYDARAVRSPSVDTASVMSGHTAPAPVPAPGPVKKKRGRKPKLAHALTAAAHQNAANLQHQQHSASSPAAGPTHDGDGGGAVSTVGSTMSARGHSLSQGNGVAAAGGVEAEEDDHEPDGPLQMELLDNAHRTQEQKLEEMRLRAMLVEAFDADQYRRYEMWRAARLSEAVVRRVVNATVSQSVPQSVVLAVKSVTKSFIGELLQAAVDLQKEWIAAGEAQALVPEPKAVLDSSTTLSLPSDPPSYGDHLDQPDPAREPSQGHEHGRDPAHAQTTSSPNLPRENASQNHAQEDLGPRREVRRGPLRPDHLREAFRRYKASGEGGRVGLLGVWHAQHPSGVERFAPRNGRRIFR